jgi:glycosyltransferase involved in cell wall biosynthesis
MIKVLHTVSDLHPDSGGPTRTVTSLVHHLSKAEDISATLVTQKLKGDEIYTGELNPSRVVVAASAFPISIRAGFPFRTKLSGLISDARPSIIHDHGIWLPTNHAVAKLAARQRVLRVVHVRGMLEPWALSYHSFKKRLAWSLYQKKDLESVALFFATSQAEADNIRNLGFNQPIAILPNGVDLPAIDVQTRFLPASGRQRNAVFMSRIHPKKGLLELVNAWGQVRPAGWTLILAGPDEGGYLKEIIACVQKLGLGGAVAYRGVVEGETKTELLKRADLFILPSFSENFGVVVAEALAYGVPAISTLGTPWKGLVENKCGWWVAAEANALAGALCEAIAMSDHERYEMGSRGRQYARQFDWGQISRETADVYRWLLGQADHPDCVRLD